MTAATGSAAASERTLTLTDFQRGNELLKTSELLQVYQSSVTQRAISDLIARIDLYRAPLMQPALKFQSVELQAKWQVLSPLIEATLKVLRSIQTAKRMAMPAQYVADGTAARLDMHKRWMSSPAKSMFGNQCNLICEAPAVLGCAAYGSADYAETISRISTIGYYQQKTYSIAFPVMRMRLHPDQIVNLPSTVQAAIGNVQGKKLDLFLVVSNGIIEKVLTKNLKLPQRYNMITHGWVYPDLQPNDAERKRLDVAMGIFEGEGVYSIDTFDGVKFGSMGNLEVYAHHVNSRMAVSPNNAHFGVAPHASIARFWSVVKCDDRILAVCNLLINDDENPFSEFIRKAAYSSKSCEDYLQKMTAGLATSDTAITDKFGTIADALKKDDEAAMKKFDALDAQHKNWIFGEVWRLKGSPKDLHADFGRASFMRDTSLAAQHHASADLRFQAMDNYITQMRAQNTALVKTQMELFRVPSQITVPTKEQKERQALLTPIVEAFTAGNVDAGMKLFHALDDKHKGAIYGLVWNLKGCPKDVHPKFGEVSFIGGNDIKKKYHCSTQDKIHALNMYIYQ